jgi:hypothetical protein
MLFSTLLAFATAVSAAAVPKPEGPNGETAVSPDGYTYTLESRSYIDETITLDDGTTATVSLHPDFKFVKREGGTSPNEKRLKFLHNNKLANQCGNSSFHKKSSGGSPKTADCERIIAHYRQTWGFFVAKSNIDIRPGGAWCRLAYTGSCAFGIKSKNQWSPQVGSTDIVDLIQASVDKFRTNGNPSRVGAEGNMGCKTYYWDATASVDWAIFST